MPFKWTMTMPIKTVRRLILTALILVVLTNLVYWVVDTWHTLGLVIWSVAVAVVTFLCRAKAGRVVQANRQYYLWLILAAILAIIPVILRLHKIFIDQPSWGQRLWQAAPVFIRFIIPVVLLWFSYMGLKGHLDKPNQAPEIPS
jgi:hypothetical protein